MIHIHLSIPIHARISTLQPFSMVGRSYTTSEEKTTHGICHDRLQTVPEFFDDTDGLMGIYIFSLQLLVSATEVTSRNPFCRGMLIY